MTASSSAQNQEAKHLSKGAPKRKMQKENVMQLPFTNEIDEEPILSTRL